MKLSTATDDNKALSTSLVEPGDLLQYVYNDNAFALVIAVVGDDVLLLWNDEEQMSWQYDKTWIQKSTYSCATIHTKEL